MSESSMGESSQNEQRPHYPQNPRVTDPRHERQGAVPHNATPHDAGRAEQADQTEPAGHASANDATEHNEAIEPVGVGGISQTWHVRVALLLVRIYAFLEANTFVPNFLPQPLRRKRFGYLAAALAEVIITLITVETVRIFPTYSFVGLLNFMLVALIALSWGAVPALVATVSGAALLEIMVFLPPFNQPLHPGGDLVEALTFLGAGLIVGVAASQTEGGRRRAVMRQLRAQAGEMGQREANRRMDEFLALVTHELKNPLSGMQLATQLAQRNLVYVLTHETKMSSESVERLQRNLGLADQIQRQASVQNRLIGDLLDISRIQSQRLELHVAPCDLVEIVRQAVEDQRLAWPNRQITLALEHCTSEGTLPIEGDAERIGQVVANYLTNALKYSTEEKPVAVSVRCEGKTARVAVRDQGPGLPVAEQKRIWERFYRVKGVNIQSGSGVGLGMGLHICKNLIERHGGRVGVESAVGRGSTFSFVLPISQQ